jgi:hypothetical protein
VTGLFLEFTQEAVFEVQFVSRFAAFEITLPEFEQALNYPGELVGRGGVGFASNKRDRLENFDARGIGRRRLRRVLLHDVGRLRFRDFNTTRTWPDGTVNQPMISLIGAPSSIRRTVRPRVSTSIFLWLRPS